MFNLKSYEKKIKFQESMLRRKNLHTVNKDKHACIPLFYIFHKKSKK